jgi:hypothetical protein
MRKMGIAKMRKLKRGDSVKFLACREPPAFDGRVVKVSRSVLFVEMIDFKMEPLLFCRKTNCELFRYHDDMRFTKDIGTLIVEF